MVRHSLHKAVGEALSALGAEESFVIERPASLEHGDYATNAAFIVAKKIHISPRDAAQKIVEKLQALPGLEASTIADSGFINFRFSREAVTEEVTNAATSVSWGTNTLYAGKTVMVEYTDPNPFKVFHIGHLMSNAIGEAIARLLEASGAKVLRANYQGDIGLHVAKALWGYRHMPGRTGTDAIAWGRAYVYGEAQYTSDPEIKKDIDSLGKEIYEHASAIPEYVEGRKMSLEHFEEIYRMLGTTFDFYFFESDTGPLGLSIVRSRPDIFVASEGAIVFRGEEYGLHTRVFITRLGLPTYEAKDLGLMKLKEDTCAFDISITVTASEQTEYYKVVLKAADILSPGASQKFLHRTHGMMRFASGKMSSRKGNVVTGESLIEELKDTAATIMAERKLPTAAAIAEQIAVGAIKYSVLKQGSGKDIVFDPEKSLSFEGDSGPYLQYAHVRASSLIKKAKEAGLTHKGAVAPTHVLELERVLIHFPDIVERCAETLEPHYLATYLTELAASFNAWYASERVIDGPYPSYGLLLSMAVEKTMRQGLLMLGIPTPEEM